MQEELILTRIEAPGKQDTAPRGTKCLVTEYGLPVAIYIQKNEDENNPKWELVEENNV